MKIAIIAIIAALAFVAYTEAGVAHPEEKRLQIQEEYAAEPRECPACKPRPSCPQEDIVDGQHCAPSYWYVCCKK